MGCGFAAAALAPLILMIELVEWATSSEWPGLTLADGLSLFGIHHESAETEAQRLLDLLLAIPLTLALFMAGVSAFLLGANMGDWREERRLMLELRDRSPLYWLTLIGADDVSLPSLVRLLLLDLLLRLIAALGVALLVLDGALLLLGSASGWPAFCGAALLAAVALTRATERRKLAGTE